MEHARAVCERNGEGADEHWFLTHSAYKNNELEYILHEHGFIAYHMHNECIPVHAPRGDSGTAKWYLSKSFPHLKCKRLQSISIPAVRIYYCLMDKGHRRKGYFRGMLEELRARFPHLPICIETDPGHIDLWYNLHFKVFSDVRGSHNILMLRSAA
jgi:hypothetical protein